ncbi:sulfite oxidase-like [Mytilus edulis]
MPILASIAAASTRRFNLYALKGNRSCLSRLPILGSSVETLKLERKIDITQSQRSASSSSTNTRGFEHEHDEHFKWIQHKMVFAAIFGLTGSVLYWKSRNGAIKAASAKSSLQPGGGVQPGLPTYTLSDVEKHKTKEKRIWVTYKNGVYDITDYVTSHPGGTKILLAAGGSIEPYWNMYGVHKQGEIVEMLEELRIGNITEKPKEQAFDKNDPYANDPKRHPAIIPASSKPFNGEPPSAILTDNFLTPNDLFYIRNHLPVPDVNLKSYKLDISVQGPGKFTSFSFDDLKRKFHKKSTAVVLQCAGNRRSEMVKIKPVKGLNWGTSAIGNAEWSGPCLDDLLKQAGIDIDQVTQKHILFCGMDKDPAGSPYEASIPIELARLLKRDIIVAYEMNGQEIPRDHGYPVRIIIPGIVGARQVKWLTSIKLSNEESMCHWQQNDYKGFHSSIDWNNVNFKSVPAIMELPVTSAICEPIEGTDLAPDADEVTVKGYAWSGGGRGIVRVDVSIDGGKTWDSATLSPPKQPMYKTFAWTFWEATLPIPKNHKGKVEIICKAADLSYNVQPDSVEGIWNLRGVLSNAWHRVNISIPKS